MEVGAVKQNFNNEVIQLKKRLNQARTQIIHKLTRKAKTLVEKKLPDAIMEKNKRKAESAVNEVLILKKIKPRDIARFTITHTGDIKSYLNKPQVDQNKACARLLLHKALYDKYKFIRDSFSNIPIKDLFMSRQERRKLKKEAKELQKMKKEKKNAKVNSAGDFKVEDLGGRKVSVSSYATDSDNESLANNETPDVENKNDDINMIDGEISNTSDVEDNDGVVDNDDISMDEDEPGTLDSNEPNNSDELESEADISNEEEVIDIKSKKHEKQTNKKRVQNKEIKLTDDKLINSKKVGNVVSIEDKLKPIIEKVQKQKKQKDPNPNKNKNLNDKLINRKFKKNSEEIPVVGHKIVDPFFITSTGGNYMSVVEPRAPDEVKEEHKQGNRKLRRAAMFGHVPKVKPKQNYNNDSFNKFDNRNGQSNNKFNNERENSDNFSKFDKNDRQNERFNRFGKNAPQNDFGSKNNNYNKSKDRFKNNDIQSSGMPPKDEKLHPSWEAKKKQSGLLPFQGKKIVFNEN